MIGKCGGASGSAPNAQSNREYVHRSTWEFSFFAE
jgi:hypothetical protein